jgi:hypothetical protein
MALNIPCAGILAKHDHGGAEAKKKASADMVARLEPVLVLGKGSRVMITRNVWQGFRTQGLVDYSIQRVSNRHRGSSDL